VQCSAVRSGAVRCAAAVEQQEMSKISGTCRIAL
jgi:hypothetical protein